MIEANIRNAPLEGLYREIHGFKTRLNFIQDEIHFLDHLLNSYEFQPNTQNLFERLQQFEDRLRKSNSEVDSLLTKISDHEKLLGGLMECKEPILGRQFYKSHESLLRELNNSIITFHDLKLEIYNYVTGILKKKKP